MPWTSRTRGCVRSTVLMVLYRVSRTAPPPLDRLKQPSASTVTILRELIPGTIANLLLYYDTVVLRYDTMNVLQPLGCSKPILVIEVSRGIYRTPVARRSKRPAAMGARRSFHRPRGRLHDGMAQSNSSRRLPASSSSLCVIMEVYCTQPPSLVDSVQFLQI